MNLRRLQTDTIKIIEPSYIDTIVFDIKSLNELKKTNSQILESDMAYYSFDAKSKLLFRVRKQTYKPKIRMVDKVAIQPDQSFIDLEPAELLEIATSFNNEVLQTEDYLIMLTDGIVFRSKLKGKE